MYLRVVLICLLVVSVHGFYIIEQPRQSLLYLHHRWQWLQQRVCYVPLHKHSHACRLPMHLLETTVIISYGSCAKVFEVAFWLMKYGCGSPKRLLLRSNWQHVGMMDLGKLPRAERLEKTKVKTSCLWLSYPRPIYT